MELATLHIYPKWKDTVPQVPTLEDFYNAFYFVNKINFTDGEFIFNNNPEQPSYTFTTKDTAIVSGIPEYTDEPKLPPNETFYYRGVGCPWSVDLNGYRFYKVDKNTNKIKEIDKLICQEIVRRYILHVYQSAINTPAIEQPR